PSQPWAKIVDQSQVSPFGRPAYHRNVDQRAAVGNEVPTISLYCPVTPQWHPESDRLGADSLAWLERIGPPLVPEHWEAVRREQMGRWMGVFIPGAESHRMRLGADFLTLIFPADDYWDSRFAPDQRDTAVQWPVRLARLLDDP